MKEKTRVYNRIKAVMVDKRKSREDLVKATGKGERMVTRYLTNEVQPPISVLFEIAVYLGVQVADLLVSATDPPVYIED